MPFQPTVHHLHRNGRLFPPNYLHDSWLDYLYWDSAAGQRIRSQSEVSGHTTKTCGEAVRRE
jgi:hypothetical protein